MPLTYLLLPCKASTRPLLSLAALEGSLKRSLLEDNTSLQHSLQGEGVAWILHVGRAVWNGLGQRTQGQSESSNTNLLEGTGRVNREQYWDHKDRNKSFCPAFRSKIVIGTHKGSVIITPPEKGEEGLRGAQNRLVTAGQVVERRLCIPQSIWCSQHKIWLFLAKCGLQPSGQAPRHH